MNIAYKTNVLRSFLSFNMQEIKKIISMELHIYISKNLSKKGKM